MGVPNSSFTFPGFRFLPYLNYLLYTLCRSNCYIYHIHIHCVSYCTVEKEINVNKYKNTDMQTYDFILTTLGAWTKLLVVWWGNLKGLIRHLHFAFNTFYQWIWWYTLRFKIVWKKRLTIQDQSLASKTLLKFDWTKLDHLKGREHKTHNPSD